MRKTQAKRIRKMAATSEAPAEDNYEATRHHFGKVTIVLAECQKALYRELKKNFKR